jgi:CRISPR-associated protein Cmr1
MRRNQPSSTPPPVPTTPTKREGVITHVREYELITPLFGGGVAPNETDPITVIRGSEIRGHLRFWWRACRAWKFGTPEKMKEAEDKLWGAAAHKDEDAIPYENTVQIVVDVSNSGQPRSYKDKNVAPQYAAFPLQSEPKPLQVGVVFKLTIMYPFAQETEVEAALWAWETFGGIGARTRRGFGALHLRSIDEQPVTSSSADNLKEEITKKLSKLIERNSFPAHVPHLSQRPQFKVIKRGFATPFAAWNNLIGALQRFRLAKMPGKNGRSQWPETEAIKDITSNNTSQNSQTHKFPKAAFGLPIVFQPKNTGDVTLQGDEVDRLASPLILRPYLCANNQAVGLALLLEGSHRIPGKLALKDRPRSYRLEESLTRGDAYKIPILHGEPDVLKAFMNYLETGGN